MKTLAAHVAEQPFFKGLSPQYFIALNQCAEIQHLRAHERMFEKGHEADRFYLVTDGEIAVETPFIPGEGVVSVQTLGQGEALGWSWLFPPYEWHFGARAATAATVIAFDANALRRACHENTAFGYEMAMRVGQMLANRLQNTRARLLNLCEPV